MEKFFLPPTKYRKDPTLAFSYFRSFIIFYYLSLFLPNMKPLFSQFYPEEYYSSYRDLFEKKQNILLFTYYNCLPSYFYPLPEPLYYYYPLATFYTNAHKTLYQHTDIQLFHTLPLRPNRKQVPNEIRVTLPTALLTQYPVDPSNWFLLKDKNQTLIGTKGKVEGETLVYETLFIKEKHDYREEKKVVVTAVRDLEYLCFLKPITKEGMLDVFPLVTLKAGSNVYANYKEDDPDKKGQFFALYPFLNMLDPFKTLPKDIQWNCYRFQVKKDVPLLHLNINPFYANAIVGYDDPEGENDDLSDLTYKKKVKSDIFRCSKVKKKNCDFDILYDFQNKTWMMNMSRVMLMLIIFKHQNYMDFKKIYYLHFLKKLGFDGMVNHTGIYRKKAGDIYLGTEIAFTTKENPYLERVEEKKGACDTHYVRNESDFE